MKQTSAAPWLVILAGIVAAMHIGKLPPSLPILQQYFQLSLNQSGFLLAAIQAAGVVCALFIGLMASRLGLKRLMVGGLVLMALAGMWESLSSQFASLFAARLLEGLGFLSVVLVGPALLRQLVVPEKLKTMMGMWAAYMGCGVAISLLVVPSLLKLLPWHQVWLMYVLVALLMAAVLVWMVPKDIAENTASTPVSIPSLIKQTLSHPAPWLVGIVFACYTSQWFTITGFLPTVYANANIAATQAGVLTAFVCLSNVLGTVLGGMLLQRGHVPFTLIATAFVCMMVGTVLTFAAQESLPFAWQYMGVIMFSMCGGLIPGVTFAYSVYLAPSAQTVPTTIAWVQELSALGQFCLPPIVGALVMWWGGWQHAWIVCMCLGMVGMVCAALMQRLINRLA